MQSLKRLEQNNAVESGEVAYRLRKAQTQLQRSVALAKEGQYSGARNLLRDGEVQEIRGDLRKLAVFLSPVRPTFDRFEALALTGALEAYDSSMREVQRGSEIVTAEDVATNGDMLMKSMEEIIALLERTPQWAEKLL